MTSTRAPVPPVDLKARIAAFQQQQTSNGQAAQGNAPSQTLPKANAANGPNALRDRIASFEKQGAVPKPKGRFGFAPPMEKDPSKRSGELYGNRVPGLSRPHIPVPPSNKTDRKEPRSRSASRLGLDRYATSPSPPGSPFVTSDNGDSIGDVLSDGELTSPGESATQMDGLQQSLDALIASTADEPSPPEQQYPEELLESAAEEDVAPTSLDLDPDENQPGESPAIVVSPSEPTGDVPAVVPDTPPPVEATSPEPIEESAPQPVSAEAPVPSPTPSSGEAMDPEVQAIIEQLDRATRSGDAGSVTVPGVSLQALAALGGSPEEQQQSVQDMLDQLLLQQDVLDVATPIKQRFSLNGSLNGLSQLAVRTYLAQQSELAAKEAKVAQKPATPEPKPKAAPTVETRPAFLSPTPDPGSAPSPDSPSTEPLSPASDIYASYLAATPAVPFGRALPAIPEAPDSPAIANPRRGTFGNESTSTAPSSPPLRTPSDDGLGSIAPSESSVKVSLAPTRVTSPPLSVVIPQSDMSSSAQPQGGKVQSTGHSRKPSAPAVQPPSASSSSPTSNYSPNSTYSDGASPSTGPVSRKVSTNRARKTLSPVPPAAPYEEPLLTPIEGPRGFRAVVHEKVVEGKSRPVSVVHQYDSLPSPTPMNATSNMGGDLAALLADAAMLEQRLSTTKTPKKLPNRPGLPSRPAPTPPPAASRGTPDRPKPSQDLPQSPDDNDLFGRLSQDQAVPPPRTSQYDTSRQSQYDTSRQSQYEHRPLPARPSIDRKPSRPSLDRMPRPSIERMSTRPSREQSPARPSLDRSTSVRPSTDSTSSSRPQLQPMFLNADPNAVRIPLPPRPKSAMGHSSRSQTSTPPLPPPKSPPKTGYLSNLLSRAKSSGNLRSTDPRDSVGSSSEDSVMVSTPPTPPYEMSINDTGSIRSSRMFKNSFSRASNFADRLLHRKDGSQPGLDMALASGDEDDSQMPGSRSLPRPPRPLPLPPRPLPPSGLPPPPPPDTPAAAGYSNNLAPIPPPGQPGLQRRGSWKSLASVSTTGISEALDTMYDSFPSVPENVPRGGPPGPNAYISPRPAPLPPTAPPPSQPLPPPPNQSLPLPPRGASHNRGLPPAGYPGLPSNPAYRPKTLPSRPKLPQQGQLRSGMI